MWWMSHMFAYYVIYSLFMKCPIWVSMFLNKALVSTNCYNMVVIFTTMVEKCSYTLSFFFLLYFLTSSEVKGFSIAPYYLQLLKHYQILLGILNYLHFFSLSLAKTLTCFITFPLQCHQLSWWSLLEILFAILSILVLFVNYIKLPLASNWSPWKSRDGSQHLDVELQPCIHPLKKNQLTQ